MRAVIMVLDLRLCGRVRQKLASFKSSIAGNKAESKYIA